MGICSNRMFCSWSALMIIHAPACYAQTQVLVWVLGGVCPSETWANPDRSPNVACCWEISGQQTRKISLLGFISAQSGRSQRAPRRQADLLYTVGNTAHRYRTSPLPRPIVTPTAVRAVFIARLGFCGLARTNMRTAALNRTNGKTS
jgi:hypothetical protein